MGVGSQRRNYLLQKSEQRTKLDKKFYAEKKPHYTGHLWFTQYLNFKKIYNIKLSVCLRMNWDNNI